MQFNIGDARRRWAYLVAAVERGEEVILARDGKPVAKIIRYQAPKVKPPGSMRGRVKISRDWGSPEHNAEIAVLVEKSAMWSR